MDSISEVYTALLAAKPLIVFSKKVTQNVESFVYALEETGVTRLFAVTSLIRSMLAVLRMTKKRSGEERIRLERVRTLIMSQGRLGSLTRTRLSL